MGITARYDEGGAATSSIMRLQAAPLLRQQVYDALEELIIYGSLEPGQRLAETELASRLAVSRNPVREALQLLHRDGWVDLKPRQGAFVHAPTAKEVDDVFDVREILEIESASRAARNAAPDALRSLTEALDAGRSALERDDERELIGANASFHATVAELADNRMLAQLLGRLDKRVRWYFAPVAERRRRDSWDEHARLVEAIASGDATHAREIMRTHTEATRRAYHAERGLRRAKLEDEGSQAQSEG